MYLLSPCFFYQAISSWKYLEDFLLVIIRKWPWLQGSREFGAVYFGRTIPSTVPQELLHVERNTYTRVNLNRENATTDMKKREESEVVNCSPIMRLQLVSALRIQLPYLVRGCSLTEFSLGRGESLLYEVAWWPIGGGCFSLKCNRWETKGRGILGGRL